MFFFVNWCVKTLLTLFDATEDRLRGSEEALLLEEGTNAAKQQDEEDSRKLPGHYGDGHPPNIHSWAIVTATEVSDCTTPGYCDIWRSLMDVVTTVKPEGALSEACWRRGMQHWDRGLYDSPCPSW